MRENLENCIAPFCTPDWASIEKKEVTNQAKKARMDLLAEMNSINWFSFEYLNLPAKNIENFKKVINKVLSIYKDSWFSFEKGNIFYVWQDMLANLAPNLLWKNDIKLTIDWSMDKVWITQELSQKLLSKNNEPITKKQIEDLCSFLNTLIKVQ